MRTLNSALATAAACTVGVAPSEPHPVADSCHQYRIHVRRWNCSSEPTTGVGVGCEDNRIPVVGAIVRATSYGCSLMIDVSSREYKSIGTKTVVVSYPPHHRRPLTSARP